VHGVPCSFSQSVCRVRWRRPENDQRALLAAMTNKANPHNFCAAGSHTLRESENLHDPVVRKVQSRHGPSTGRSGPSYLRIWGPASEPAITKRNCWFDGFEVRRNPLELFKFHWQVLQATNDSRPRAYAALRDSTNVDTLAISLIENVDPRRSGGA